MKLKALLLTSLALLLAACGSGTNASTTKAAAEDNGLHLPVPRVVASLPSDDTAAVEKYLVSLIEEEEGTPANVPNAPEEKDLHVFFDKGESPCKLAGDGSKLACDVFYERGRWNGTLHAELTVQAGLATSLTAADFDGSY